MSYKTSLFTPHAVVTNQDLTDIVQRGRARSPAPFPVSAGNRNQVPTTTSTTTNPARNIRLHYAAPQTTGFTGLFVQFDNWFSQPTGPSVATNLPALTITAVAVEYPLGTVTQAFCAGSASAALPPGESAVFACPVNIPAAASYYVRYHYVIAGTGTLTQLINQLVAPGRNDAAMSSADPTDVRVLSGTITAVGSVGQQYGPSSVTGVPTGPTRSVLLVGDSILRNSGASASQDGGVTVQGDWRNDANLGYAPYLNLGNTGWGEMAVMGRLPLLNLSVASAQAGSFTLANKQRELAMARGANPTDVIWTLGVNDLLQNTAGATVVARIAAGVALLRQQLPGVRVHVCPISPVSNSSDVWVTKGNQSLSGTLAAGGTPSNWALFTATDGSTGRSHVNAQLRANAVGADSVIDVSRAWEDPTDERLWRTDLGKATGDGIHPINELHAVAAQAVDFPRLFGLPDPDPALAKVTLSAAGRVGTATRRVYCQTAAGPITLTLPRCPLQGRTVRVIDVDNNAGTNNITINDAAGNPVASITANSGARDLEWVSTDTASKYLAV